MATGIISRPEGITKEMYDAVNAKLDLDGSPPDGLVVHCSGELDGRFQIFDIWESRAHFDRFNSGRLLAALVAVAGEEAVAAMPDAEHVEVELHSLHIP